MKCVVRENILETGKIGFTLLVHKYHYRMPRCRLECPNGKSLQSSVITNWHRSNCFVVSDFAAQYNSCNYCPNIGKICKCNKYMRMKVANWSICRSSALQTSLISLCRSNYLRPVSVFWIMFMLCDHPLNGYGKTTLKFLLLELT
jgi:hypothetical protein